MGRSHGEGRRRRSSSSSRSRSRERDVRHKDKHRKRRHSKNHRHRGRSFSRSRSSSDSTDTHRDGGEAAASSVSTKPRSGLVTDEAVAKAVAALTASRAMAAAAALGQPNPHQGPSAPDTPASRPPPPSMPPNASFSGGLTPTAVRGLGTAGHTASPGMPTGMGVFGRPLVHLGNPTHPGRGMARGMTMVGPLGVTAAQQSMGLGASVIGNAVGRSQPALQISQAARMGRGAAPTPLALHPMTQGAARGQPHFIASGLQALQQQQLQRLQLQRSGGLAFAGAVAQASTGVVPLLVAKQLSLRARRVVFGNLPLDVKLRSGLKGFIDLVMKGQNLTIGPGDCVVSASLDLMTGKALVEFRTVKEAQTARVRLSGTKFGDRLLTTEWPRDYVMLTESDTLRLEGSSVLGTEQDLNKAAAAAAGLKAQLATAMRPASTSEPTVVCLSNLVSDEVLEDEEASQDVIDDVHEKCELEHGKVLKVLLVRKKNETSEILRAFVGQVFVKFSEAQCAAKAVETLHGQNFAGRQVKASLLSPSLWEHISQQGFDSTEIAVASDALQHVFDPAKGDCRAATQEVSEEAPNLGI